MSETGTIAVDLANKIERALDEQPTAAVYLALGMVLGRAYMMGQPDRRNLDEFMRLIRKTVEAYIASEARR